MEGVVNSTLPVRGEDGEYVYTKLEVEAGSLVLIMGICCIKVMLTGVISIVLRLISMSLRVGVSGERIITYSLVRGGRL